MENEAEFEVPTWNQIYSTLRNQAEKIRRGGFKLDVIVGVTRGGWIPARILSDLPDLATVGVEFYLGVPETREEPVLTKSVSAVVEGKKKLLVDDDADTGKSLQLAGEHLRQQGTTEVQIATLYYKPLSVITPDYYEKQTRRWVVFTWDAKETVRKIIEKSREKSVANVNAAKLVKAGLPKQLVEEVLKEAVEAGKC